MIATSALAVLPFPMIDPVIFQIGPLAVRWYSLAYIFGLILGWRYILRLLPKYAKETKRTSAPTKQLSPPMSKEDVDDFLMWAVLGIVIGGRLGYILFYQAGFYFAHPTQALMLWRGGMSFHGGFLGFLLALILFGRRRKLPILGMADLMVCAAPIGLFLGRLANFINGELYGRETNVPWAMIFPTGGPTPRHPSQLYEAALEGAVLFLILWLLFRRPRWRESYGALTGAFLVGYSVARIIVELFRQPDQFLGLFAGLFTMGQILSLPMGIAGIYLVLRSGIFRKKIV